MKPSSPVAEVRSILETAGFRAALEFLNQRVPHRYTIVYRFDGEAFYGMVVVDKLAQPVPSLFNRVPFVDSFCQYTVAEGEFSTPASLQDHRLEGHLHRANVQSYCGLPLTDPSGALYGTFCHLDLVPQTIGDAEYSFLQKAVLVLGEFLPATSELTGS